MAIVSFSDYTNFKLLCFSLLCLCLIYLVNSAISRKWRQIKLKPALLYMSSVAMIGVYGEIFVGSLYKLLFDNTLWVYRVYPIHDGYTSRYGVFLWAMLGFHLYLLGGFLKEKGI